nr:methyl-accepting chemotaxis protein [uncultured Butyricicoccus sp.]
MKPKSKPSNRHTSIKTQIIALTLGMTILASLIIGIFAAVFTKRSAQDVLNVSMQETATVAANSVSAWLDKYATLAEGIGLRASLTDPATPDAEKQQVLQQYAQQNNLITANLLNSAGYSVFENLSVADRPYFQEAMKGNTYVSDPVVRKDKGDIVFVMAAPLWQDGEYGGSVVGAISIVPEANWLNDIVSSIQIGSGGSAYILNSSGDVIASKNTSDVLNVNLQDSAQVTKQNQQQADMEKKMIAGESGVAQIKSSTGSNLIAAYTPIPDTNGWSIAIYAEQNDFMTAVTQSIIITIIIVIIFIVLASFGGIKFGRTISNTIHMCVSRLQKLAQGDLKSPVPQIQRNDELGMLAQATASIVHDLNVVIADEQRILGALADGNFQVQLHNGAEKSYTGDFSVLLESMTVLRHHLNDTLVQIDQAAAEVARGADQVSGGAQELSQGATEQASSVQELAATMLNISKQVEENADNAHEASQKSKETSEELLLGKEKMQNLVSAMDEIDRSSSEIGKIIKAIEDIAFQTNILALNAAVEAARAGAAGKGFAVVADEVRNLASKSAEASKSTTELVENSIRAVKQGTDMARETSESLDKIVQTSEQASQLVHKISDASRTQAEAVEQVNIGLDQISSVVSTNSATAEQSAATSQELSGQSQMLKNLISQFQLNQQDAFNSNPVNTDFSASSSYSVPDTTMPMDWDSGSDSKY